MYDYDMLLYDLPTRPYRKGKTTMTSSNLIPSPCPICNTRRCDSTNLHSEALLAGVRTTDHRTTFANRNYRDPIGK